MALVAAVVVLFETMPFMQGVFGNMWYVGPINRVAALDFVGAIGDQRVTWFAVLSVALIVSAVVGRARQIRT